MTASTALLWDFAGFDGLALARDQFGPAVSELAAYQSLDTEGAGIPVRLLRLCENNFRVRVSAAESDAFASVLRANAAGQRVWVKPSGLGVLSLGEDALGEDALKSLLPITTVKPPHRLVGLPPHRAVPARVGGHAALIWRPGTGEAVEIQVAGADHAAVSQIVAQRNAERSKVKPVPDE